MKPKLLASIALLTSTTVCFAAGGSEPGTKSLQIYPKNLARQHVGSNLFLFNPTNNSYAPTEAAAAWLDDDVTTGWPVMSGKQSYLLTLAEPMLLTNFALSTRPATGTVTLYAGDEPAAPGAKSWTVVAKDIPVETINQRRLEKPFSRFAKYLLIETDIADPGPLFSLYVYGDRPAVSFQLNKRETPIDTRAIFGPYVNNKTSYSVAGLYAHSSVAFATGQDGFVAWQKAIDDNPESSVSLASTANEAGMVLKMDAAHRVSRFAVLTKAPAKGKLDFFVLPSGREVTQTAPAAPADEIVKVSNPTEAASIATAPSVQGLTPTVTMVLDGSNARGSIDFPPVEGSSVLVRWTPATEGEAIVINELNAFNDISLSEYELALEPAAVAELDYDASKGGAGKDFKDAKGLAPVGEFLPTRSPYLPGALGFPPQLGRRTPVSNPDPISP